MKAFVIPSFLVATAVAILAKGSFAGDVAVAFMSSLTLAIAAISVFGASIFFVALENVDHETMDRFEGVKVWRYAATGLLLMATGFTWMAWAFALTALARLAVKLKSVDLADTVKLKSDDLADTVWLDN